MANLMTINLSKTAGASWGFRLQGGKDFATPLCIQKVNVGSVAERAGLQAGDAIVSINNQDALSLRHKEAQDAIVRAGNAIEIVIQRGAQVWKPQVTALPEKTILPDGVPVATKTSLAATPKVMKPIGSGHNTSAAPFGEPRIVNLQYNSPLPLYSEDSIAETLSAQAEMLDKGVLGVNFMKNDKSYDGRASDVLRMVQEMDKEPHHEPAGTPTHPMGSPDRPVVQGHSFKILQRVLDDGVPQHHDHHAAAPTGDHLQPGENICSGCQRLIVGVFVRIKNKNLHAECFKCATCGSSLKNVGYYNIHDKLYCDIHAKQAARSNPPAPHLEPVTVEPGAHIPPGAVMTAPSGKMKIPTAFQHDHGHVPAPAAVHSPVPAPHHKPFAPAPAPAPVVAAPTKPAHAPAPAPSTFRPAANPQAFGAPAGDVNVRTHIPKKAEKGAYHWPPPNFRPDAAESAPSHPHKKKPTQATSRPLSKPFSKPHTSVKPYSPKPLPTTKQPASLKAKGPSFPASRPSKASRRSPPRRTPRKSPGKPTLRLFSDRFPNPAPSYILKFSGVMENQEGSQLYRGMKGQSHAAGAGHFGDAAHSEGLVDAVSTAAAHHRDEKVASLSAGLLAPPRSRVRSKISPIRERPVDAPMPSVNLQSTTKQTMSFESSLRKYTSSFLSSSTHHSSSPKLGKSAPASKPGGVRGFKTMKGPTATSVARAKSPVPPSKVKIEKPKSVDPLVFDMDSLKMVDKDTKGDVPAPMTFAPAPAPAPVPAPAPMTFAPAPAPAPMTFAPAPAPAPIPKPAPPPSMGPKIGPGGPVRGVPQAPGQRSAPRRGRGVMNQASASRIPMCSICQRQIRGPFVSALGKTWCPDHFVCATSTCKRSIIDMGFVEERGQLYCEVCYENYLAPICGKCDKRVKGDCLNAVGKQFHPECFCCAYCGVVFGSGAFYLEDGLPYCEADWNDLFTTKCVGCNFPIEAGDRWVEALNNNYHSQCFKCSKCHKNLEGQSFFAKGGKPFCKAHAQRGF